MRTYNKHEISLLFEDTDRFVEERDYNLMAESMEWAMSVVDNCNKQLFQKDAKIAELESRLNRYEETAKCEMKN